MGRYIIVAFLVVIFSPVFISAYTNWFDIPRFIELKGNFPQVESPQYNIANYKNGLLQKQISEYNDKQNKIKDIYIYIYIYIIF